MSKEESKRFDENLKKLETLSQQLQNNQISIDELIPRMQDAVGALKICKGILAETKIQLKEMSAEFEELKNDETLEGTK